MPKRKRADSEPSLPLTCENLEHLQRLLSPATQLASMPPRSRPASPTRTANTLDAREKLAQYRIHVDTGAPLPAGLVAHVESVIKKPRARDETPSPNAKKIVARCRYAAQQNESTGIRQIAPYMLPTGAAEADDRVEGVPLIVSKTDVSLNRWFLPPTPNNTVKETWKDLSQPKPDTCIGYLTRSDAAAVSCDAPFTTEDEETLNIYSLTQHMYFPFLTTQWKSPNGNETLNCAQNQAARDGAVIVQYQHEFYSIAHGSSLSPVDTCHFSFVSDVNYGEIWVHWREGMNFHMEQIFSFSLRYEAEVQTARGYLRNICQYAVTERLESIRKSLPLFAQNRRDTYPPVSVSHYSASVTSVSQSSSSRLAFQAPPTPSSVEAEPVKKRQRTASSQDASVG
jgi:hypothetical protein